MLQFMDQPITNGLITAILASVNAFLRSLIQRGALIAGAASFNPSENPPSQIAAGQLIFDIDVMPPPPAERLTFNVYIDSTLLSQLGNTSAITGTAANA
jgi:phage tail sheath protein FI